MLPAFNSDGLLPPGDYELTIPELRDSFLVQGGQFASLSWDAEWRLYLVNNLEVLVEQLHTVGITEIFIAGSFVENIDHPGDIDGYFECDFLEFINLDFHEKLNALDHYKSWTWNPNDRLPDPINPIISKPPMWHHYRVELFPSWKYPFEATSGIRDQYDQDQPFSVAFRKIASKLSAKGHCENSENNMIRNELEYKETERRVQEELARVEAYKANLSQHGLDSSKIELVVGPILSFVRPMQEEIEEYRRLRHGDLSSYTDLRQLGQLLVAARIATDMTQRELSKTLQVSESQISRDERNNYHGITLERLWKTLDALKVTVKLIAYAKIGHKSNQGDFTGVNIPRKATVGAAKSDDHCRSVTVAESGSLWTSGALGMPLGNKGSSILVSSASMPANGELSTNIVSGCKLAA